MIFVMGFLVLGFIYMVFLFFANMPLLWLVIIADVLAFLTVIYAGFAMNFVNGIPLWNTALLPILYVAAGFWGGAELAAGVAATTGAEAELAHTIAYILLLAVVVIIPAYLISARYSSPAGDISVKEIVASKRWPIFWFLVVIIGIIIPVVVALSIVISGMQLPLVLTWVAIICGLIGDLTMRYLLLRNGYYAPMTPISDVPTSAV
jgi:formate-dependent nitrite reductase membrane component NrfD